MKKSIALLIPFFFLTFITSCSNDEKTHEEEQVVVDFQEENPLPDYLNITGYNQQYISMENTNQHEMGFSFKPLKRGKINSIVVNLPEVDADLTVKVWDLRANVVIRTETINVNAANSEITKTIAPLELIKNNEYAITMIPDNYFKNTRNDSGTPNHPITIGNVKISGSYLSSQNPQFITLIGMYNGNCSFNFSRTE